MPSLLSLSRADLVPIFSFGDNNLYSHAKDSGFWWKWFSDQLYKKIGLTIPLFYGRGVFQYSFGFMPYRLPITTVGEPRPGLG